MKELNHYSTKTSHLHRSEYWRDVRRYSHDVEILSKKSVTYLIRRSMLRTPKDGKR